MTQLDNGHCNANVSPFKISGLQRRKLRKELSFAKRCLLQCAADENIEEEDLQPLREEVWQLQDLLKEKKNGIHS